MRDAILSDSLVAPFCHSPMRLRVRHRSLFRRQLARGEFEAGLLRATDLGWLERLWYLFEGIN
jgi:hypothetical protein